MTLAFEYANSKLVEVVTVADVDDEVHVGNSLFKLSCRFRSWGLVIKLNFCSDFEYKVWSRIWIWSSGKILEMELVSILLMMSCRGFEVESWSRFWSWVWSIFSNQSLVEMLMFDCDFEIDAWCRIGKWNLIKTCVRTCDMIETSYFGKLNSTLVSVVPLAMFQSTRSFEMNKAPVIKQSY